MDEGLKNLIRKADQGDVGAMVMVGDCYNKGIQTEKDDRMSHIYYKKAADAGHVKAAAMVAIDYLNGVGVSKDKTVGIKYLHSAADGGEFFAQYLLASLYKEGEVTLFFGKEKAIKYYEMAAKQGDAKSQIELALLLLEKKKSLEDVVFWLVCAYLHGMHKQSLKESDIALKMLNNFIENGIPGGKKWIEEVIDTVKKKYPSYTKAPS